jgi:hypothetical protein
MDRDVLRGYGGVEERRGRVQDRRRLKQAASFVVAFAEKSIAPFPLPAHRTGRDHFGHPALGRISRRGMRRSPTRSRVERKHTQLPKHPLWRELPEARAGDLMPAAQNAADRVVQHCRGLYHPISDRGYAEWALAHAPRFGNHHPFHRLRSVASCSHLLPQGTEPAVHPVCFNVREGFSVHARRAPVCTATRVGVGEDVFPPHLVIQTVKPPRRLLLGFHVESARWSVRIFSGVTRLTPISCSRLVQAHSEPGLLSSPGITRVPRSNEPLRRRSSPAPDGVVAKCLDSPTGLPCCESLRVCVLRPLPRRAGRPSRVGKSGRPRRPSSYVRRLSARIDSFGACSGFTRVAARTLAGPPNVGFCPWSFDGSVTLAAFQVATKAYRQLLGPDLHRLH